MEPLVRSDLEKEKISENSCELIALFADINGSFSGKPQEAEVCTRQLIGSLKEIYLGKKIT